MDSQYSAKFLRREWFGGFEYRWKDNLIEELSVKEFNKRVLKGEAVIKSDYPYYLPCPIRINFDLTYLCDRNCFYCHSNSGAMGPISIEKEMKVGEIKKVLKDCERMGVFEITLTGGEPLLKKGIFEILEYAGNLKNVFCNLITNGMYVNKKVAQKIKQAGIDRVCISIDGFEETMERHRWHGSYGITMTALKDLISAGLNVGVISVITQQNFNEFESFVKMLYKLGVRNHNSSALCDIGRASNNWLGLNQDQLLAFSRKATVLIKKMKSKDYDLTFNNAIMCLGPKPKQMPIYIFETAIPGWKCIVKSNGDVIYNRVWGAEFRLGSVRRNSLYDLWYNSEQRRAEYLKKIYQKFISGEMSKAFYRVDNPNSKIWQGRSALSYYYQNE